MKSRMPDVAAEPGHPSDGVNPDNEISHVPVIAYAVTRNFYECRHCKPATSNRTIAPNRTVDRMNDLSDRFAIEQPTG